VVDKDYSVMDSTIKEAAFFGMRHDVPVRASRCQLCLGHLFLSEQSPFTCMCDFLDDERSAGSACVIRH